jgi:hypothetical protein
MAMDEKYRIPVDAEFASALGRVVYNFSYLEWCVIWICAKLTDSLYIRDAEKTAGGILSDLRSAVKTAELDSSKRARLDEFILKFESLITIRNHVLHSHPYTVAESRDQGLWRQKIRAPIAKSPADLHEIAHRFEVAAIEANAIFHRELGGP